MSIVLDTHAVVWYLLGSDDLPSKIYELIDTTSVSGGSAFVSVISLVEIVYLVERDRIPAEAYARLVRELGSGVTTLSIVPLDATIANAMREVPRDRVSDMPDRIIAATALHLGAPLVTRDRRLQAAGIRTIW
jgi:PIN domain nuclease of toxin-antitoxin system